MFAKFLLVADQRARPPVGQIGGQALENLEQAVTALGKLDGVFCSMLTVAERPPAPESDLWYSGRALMIAGGKNNEYFCTFYDEDNSKHAINPLVHASRGDYVLIRCGELESVSRQCIIDRIVAAEALKAFVAEGKLTDQLIWESPKMGKSREMGV